ncbi:MAG TPA: YjbH domain-containing protein, partial [Verrucomicrobiae bacterium]|nr:YjbH domain-containing protein [Verrucomicrobiae bacterium]
GPLRLSAGYGTGPDRMRGFFGGVEARAASWLYLLGEHSAEENAVGLRLVSPRLRWLPAVVQATAKTSLDGGRMSFALGAEIPLPGGYRTPPDAVPSPAPAAPTSLTAAAASPSVPAAGEGKTVPEPVISPNTSSGRDSVRLLRRRLAEEGFQNVRVGRVRDLLLVEYENARYNWNELDGLGIVLFRAARVAPPEVTRIGAVVKKRNLRIIRVEVPREALERFRTDPMAAAELRDSLRVSYDVSGDGGLPDGKEENGSFATSSLTLAPGLSTFIGNEFASFSWMLSLRPELQVALWKGGIADLRWDVPVAWSNEFDDGGFVRNSRPPARLDRVMLFQGVQAAPGVTATLGAGMIYQHQMGTLNELALYSPEGTHRLRLKQIYARNSETRRVRESYIASYRYWFAPLDLAVETGVGRFWSEDKGMIVEVKRFFGDLALSLYYKNTSVPRGASEQRWQAAGAQLSFPLTPRRDMKAGILQVKGTEEFNYAQETTLTSRGNTLAPVPLAINVQPTINTERTFYGRDRLTPAYIRDHLPRLREAYLRYGGD